MASAPAASGWAYERMRSKLSPSIPSMMLSARAASSPATNAPLRPLDWNGGNIRSRSRVCAGGSITSMFDPNALARNEGSVAALNSSGWASM